MLHHRGTEWRVGTEMRKRSWTEKNNQMLLVSKQTFLWPLCSVTVENEAVIGLFLILANATCAASRIQNQGSVLLNNERIKPLCHLIALIWRGCWIYSVYTETSISPAESRHSTGSPFFAFVSTPSEVLLCCVKLNLLTQIYCISRKLLATLQVSRGIVYSSSVFICTVYQLLSNCLSLIIY